MSRRCSSRNRRAAVVGFAALVALTRRTAEAQSSANPAYGTYRYIGCFKDQRDRAMPYTPNPKVVTQDNCAMLCVGEGFKYMGLQFEHECFCGDDYDKWGEVDLTDSADDERRCDMVLEDDPDVEAGGYWTMSVYEILNSDDDASSQLDFYSSYAAQAASSSNSDGNAGGDTNADDEKLGVVESGKRAFTVVNQCRSTIRVGSTGGRITFGDNKDDADKDNCDAWGASAVYNSGPMGIGCYWDFPPEESGNTDGLLAPGKSFRYPLYDTDSDTRWSGTIWGSTGCDVVNGCLTGVCYSPDTDYICPAYVGPGGPTTKAEFTLSDGYKDYYDVSAIDGVNLPMMIAPDAPVFPPAEESEAQNIKKYECGSPGAPQAHHEGLGGCSWSYENNLPTSTDDMSQYVRLVKPADYDNPVKCESDADCAGITCGVHPQRWANGAYKGGVEQGSCGDHIAWVSAGGACAGGWTTGEFPDAHPFFCGESVANGMRANMYGCHGGEFAHSGYTPGASDTSCGCPDWENDNYGLKAPPISDCNGVNPEWVSLAMPWAAHLKKACPTAYTFPYDDQTSTFTCFDGDGPGSEDYVNTQSYTITFCPGDSEEAMFG